jgi:hypothetical protein
VFFNEVDENHLTAARKLKSKRKQWNFTICEYLIAFAEKYGLLIHPYWETSKVEHKPINFCS